MGFLQSEPTILSSRSGPDFVHLQEAVIPNWHFWSSVLQRRPHALRSVLRAGVTFAGSHGRFRVCIFNLPALIKVSPF